MHAPCLVCYFNNNKVLTEVHEKNGYVHRASTVM